MQRYFIESTKKGLNERFFITGDDVHHISRVMRMKANDVIICCFNDGFQAKCKIVQITNENVECEITEWIEQSNELPVEVVIVSGLPKGDKLEWIIQKGTELGASTFIPFNAARSVVKLDQKKAAKKVERWGKIAKEAAEQSHRSKIPNVESPKSLQEIIQLAEEADVKVVAYEEVAKDGEVSQLHQSFNQLSSGGKVFALFGPEGGLTDKEIGQLIEAGFVICGLGPRILRAETAPLYFLSAISYHFELMR